MRTQELNLLNIFDAIMTESSITKAAKQLNMTQPAVSNAVARMRHIWNDDLFVKHGRKIIPTARAQNLWQQIRAPLKEIESALEPDNFEPLQSKRTFRVAATDAVVGLAWQTLRSNIEKEAPNISIHTYPYTMTNGERMLNDGEVDLLIAASNLMPPIITSEFLFEIKYVCVMKCDHELANEELTLKRFAKANHLLAAPSGDISSFTDNALAEFGLKTNIALTVNGFANISNILNNTNLICVLPSIFVEESLVSGALISRELPIQIANTRVSMYWHKRSEKNYGRLWLSEKLTYILKDKAKRHEELLALLIE